MQQKKKRILFFLKTGGYVYSILIQSVKKVSDHPTFVSYEDFIQKNPLKRRIVVKLVCDRELCLLYPVVVFG